MEPTKSTLDLPLTLPNASYRARSCIVQVCVIFFLHSTELSFILTQEIAQAKLFLLHMCINISKRCVL